MAHLPIVTPSYRPDLGICELLAEGVARFASADYRHVVIVPGADLSLFRERVGRFGATVLPEEELLPSWLLRLPLARKWQLTPLGWPVRGWIRQQVIKIAFASLSTAEAVVFADSDTCLVRPIGAEMVLRPGGRVRLLADPADGNVPTHHPWYRGASQLLGLAPEDYSGYGFIGNLVPWVPDVARAMVRRVEEVAGRSWRWVLLHERTLSEYVLYGVFAQKVLGFDTARLVAEAHKPVLEYWEDRLSDEALLRFVETLDPQHVAIHIQSKTAYSFDVYAGAVRAVWRSLGVRSCTA
jgi:Family of unknown function (DUF6492)